MGVLKPAVENGRFLVGAQILQNFLTTICSTMMMHENVRAITVFYESRRRGTWKLVDR